MAKCRQTPPLRICSNGGDLLPIGFSSRLSDATHSRSWNLPHRQSGPGAFHFAPAQNKELTADESIPIPKVEFDARGELKMTASPNSSPNDFDFLVGKWKMHNRHLDKRLANCHTWTEFDSSDVNTKILNGAADMDTYSTTQFPGMGGKLFEGLTLRLFDPKTRLGVSTGSRAIRERSILPSSVRSIKTAWAIFSAKTRSMANRSSSSSLGCTEQRSPCLGSSLFTG